MRLTLLVQHHLASADDAALLHREEHRTWKL